MVLLTLPLSQRCCTVQLLLYACRGRLQTIMVTGDHYLTATAVAQVTGMLNFKQKHFLIAQPETVFIRESTIHLPTVSSLEGTANSMPLDRYGQILRTKSALPIDLKAVADSENQPQVSGGSRSKSLSNIETGAVKPLLKGVSGTRFSSKPIVAKPALQSTSPRQPAQLPSVPASQMHLSQANLQQHQQPAQIEYSPPGLLHARSSEPCMFQQLTAQADADDLCHLQQPAVAEPDPSQDALSFIMAEEGRLVPLPQREAVAMIAEGHQCIITGPVFDYLLQHAEPSLLETVLHNVAVCARMRSHQKAQLVQLLSNQGLTVSSTRKFKVRQAFLML